MKHEIPAILASGGGAIVNTSSGAGVVGFAGLPHYVASKHGVVGLTKTAAIEYAKQGLRVNAVLPGTTNTPMIQQFTEANPDIGKMVAKTVGRGRLGEPEEIAEAAVWLCSDRASFVSGESMLVDGATVCR
jgi:NAD(P)-dependent dehydrogenase (short-subunit alcohol dehydrogenase family)